MFLNPKQLVTAMLVDHCKLGRRQHNMGLSNSARRVQELWTGRGIDFVKANSSW
jgi:hypothetical protein